MEKAAATSRMDANKTNPSGSSGSGSSGVKVNTHVPGHRQTYKDAGISKQQIRAGRTRDNQQTPEQEHQARAAGIIVEPKKPPATIHLDKQCMKDLMDWMWCTRHVKFADSLSVDKLWAPAGTIPRQMRPRLSQLEQYDWALQNPYPGWMLAIDQGASGWKCKLMTDEEFSLFSTGVGRSANPKSITRAKAAGPRTDEQRSADICSKVDKRLASTPSVDPEAEVAAKRKWADSPSSSDGVSSEDSSGKDFAERGSIHCMTCMTELGVSRDELNGVML